MFHILPLRLLAVFAYFAIFSSFDDDLVEVAGVVNGAYGGFYYQLMMYEQALLEDPANAPVQRVAKSNPEVTLPSGTVVRGKEYSKSRAFHNIPYAEPPIGDLRFEDPVPYHQSGMIDATNDESIVCTQYCQAPFCTGTVSEDCLFLSVQVPGDYTYDPNNLLPVMVWIHGGGFAYGSHTDKLYFADNLSNATDTIIVSMNYRLGFLGFLTMDKEGISGNQGIKDQRMAMKWVHDNIAAFGGDKDQVTLFGESAGAQAVEFHLVSPLSQPYFNRAIVQSTYATPYPTREAANTVTDIMIAQFQLRFKCNFIQSGLDCLRSLPYEDFLELTDVTRSSTLSFMGARSTFIPDPRESNILTLFESAQPYVDGVDVVGQPSELYKSGQWSTDKDILIGHTSGEFTVFELLPYPVDRNQAIEWSNHLFGETVGSTLMSTYENIYPSLNPAEQLGNSLTDAWFACYARSIARDMEATTTGKVYFYEFAQPSSARDVATGQLLGPQGKAIHSGELEYLFGHPYNGNTGYQYTGDDAVVSKLMMDFWGSFATQGAPSSDMLPNWPQYTADVNGNWPYVNIAAQNLTVFNNLLEDVCNYWDTTNFWA